jgi:DHA2 family multidrug resistance protein
MIETAALARAIGDAWALTALLTVAALLCVPFARRTAVAPPR